MVTSRVYTNGQCFDLAVDEKCSFEDIAEHIAIFATSNSPVQLHLLTGGSLTLLPKNAAWVVEEV